MSPSLGAHCDITLKESDPEMRKTGDSVRLSCKITGFSFSSYDVHWVRQAPNKGLQWVGYTTRSFESRFKATEDASNSIAYLDITGLQPSDTAVYYCARDPHCGRLKPSSTKTPKRDGLPCSVKDMRCHLFVLFSPVFPTQDYITRVGYKRK